MSHKVAGNFAARVSRVLRRNGILCTGASSPHSREAIRVRSSEQFRCSISFDLDNLRRAARLAQDCAEILQENGYDVREDYTGEIPRLEVRKAV